MLETVISGITQIGFFGWGVALLSCLFRNQTGRKMGIIGVAIGIASIVTIYILRVSGPWGLLSPLVVMTGWLMFLMVTKIDEAEFTVGRVNIRFKVQPRVPKEPEDPEGDELDVEGKILPFERPTRSDTTPRPL